MLNISKVFDYFHLGRYKLFSLASDLLGFFYIKIYCLAIIILNLACWAAVIVIDLKIKEDSVVLHYNVDFGVNLIGSEKQLYIIPILGFLTVLINFTILSFFYRQNKFLSHLL